VSINDVLTHYALPEIPMASSHDAGHGTVHGDDGIAAMAQTRVIVDGALPLAKEPWWPPVPAAMAALARSAKLLMGRDR
jgi:hypothetical protein